jgi:hypothetical protein
MWCHEPKRTSSAMSPGSRVINPWFLRVVVTPHQDTVKIGINIRKPSPRQKQKSNDQKGKAKKEESEVMSEARDKKMKLKRRLDEEKAIKVMRACRFRRYDETR